MLRIPATSANLGPGFDTLGLALGLYNYFEVIRSKSHNVRVEGNGADIPRLSKNNNFIKIFKEVYTELGGNENDNFSFYCKNEIPFSRGLGSSSTVVIGAIIYAYYMLGIEFNKNWILQKALKYEGHADNITSALNGGFNISIVKNNKITFIKNKIANEIKAVVVVPNRCIVTKYSRKSLPLEYSFDDVIFNLSRASMLSGIFLTKKWNLLKIASEDKLHQDQRMSLYPVLFSIKKEALKEGALMSVLSGSGSSILNICYRDDSTSLAQKLKDRFCNFEVLELDFDNTGAIFNQL